jgi:hypothetical protein
LTALEAPASPLTEKRHRHQVHDEIDGLIYRLISRVLTYHSTQNSDSSNRGGLCADIRGQYYNCK